MKDYVLKNVAPGDSRVIHGVAGAEFIYVKSALGLISLTFDNAEKSEQVPQGAKLKFDVPLKSEIRVENLTSISQDYIIVAGKGDYEEPQLIGEVETRNKPLQGIKTQKIAVVAANGEFIALPADPFRYGLTVMNTGSVDLLIGGVDVATNGYLLKVGAEKEIKSATGAELYVFSTGADSQISTFEEYETVNISFDTSNALLTESGAVLYDESGNILTVE